MRIAYSDEPRPLGTGGALRYARDKFCTRTVLLMNGDSYCGTSLGAFARFHAALAADLSMVAAAVPDCSRFGKVHLNDRSQIVRFDEKLAHAGSGWINAGIYLFAADLIDEIPEDRSVSFEREMIPHWIAARKRVAAHCCDDVFLDIGTPESYARAETFFAGQLSAA
jgi:NDP-sugar pyrophosphorylase family protein